MLLRWLFEDVLTWDRLDDLNFFSFSTIKKILAVLLVVVVVFFLIDGVYTITHHVHTPPQTQAVPRTPTN